MDQKNFLLINKPVGWTSHDVVGFIRKRERPNFPDIKNLRVGHAGTLDPFATGLLIVGVGREATKRLDEFKNLPKTYTATVLLGATSSTGDPSGEITLKHESIKTLKQDVEKILKKFLGKQQQIPPMYSAKKIGGKKLYELARAGKTVERKPSAIEIYEIKMLNYDWPRIEIEIKCSAGTYIRTLAEDIGRELGTGAYCEKLTRTAIGEYRLENAVSLLT